MIKQSFRPAGPLPEGSGRKNAPGRVEVFLITGWGYLFISALAILTKKEHKTGTDRIHEVFQKINSSDIDLVMNLQGDEPLMNIEEKDIIIGKPLTWQDLQGLGLLF